VTRLAGADRYATAAAVSQHEFDAGVSTVFIATGLNFPDALAAAPASSLNIGPILLVAGQSIPAATRAELTRLAPQKIVILGGTGVISSGVATQLDQYTTGPVIRISGANRYETAVAASQHFFTSAETVYVASGLGFPDALAGGAGGGAYRGPLLLVPGTSLPTVVRDELIRLQPARIFILGGTGVISDALVAQIDDLFP
jgi:putative cell wall-binding protein